VVPVFALALLASLLSSSPAVAPSLRSTPLAISITASTVEKPSVPDAAVEVISPSRLDFLNCARDRRWIHLTWIHVQEAV
jgi:hypothetical protein